MLRLLFRFKNVLDEEQDQEAIAILTEFLEYVTVHVIKINFIFLIILKALKKPVQVEGKMVQRKRRRMIIQKEKIQLQFQHRIKCNFRRPIFTSSP